MLNDYKASYEKALYEELGRNFQNDIINLVEQFIFYDDKRILNYINKKYYKSFVCQNINQVNVNNKGFFSPLSKVIEHNDKKALKIIIQHSNLNINQIYDPVRKWSVIFNSNTDITRMLIKYGVNINIVDSLGSSPLLDSVEMCDLPKVLLLKSNKAILNIKNKEGDTALQRAVKLKRLNNHRCADYKKIIKILQD